MVALCVISLVMSTCGTLDLLTQPSPAISCLKRDHLAACIALHSALWFLSALVQQE